MVAAILGRMCGIAGTAGGSARPGPARAHGPDDAQARPRRRRASGTTSARGLAVRRLAIIDLHERSNQPLHLGPLHLVFNGEVYNYRELRDELRGLGHEFVTEGDAEVLLHAWAAVGRGRARPRQRACSRFAIWDDGERRR